MTKEMEDQGKRHFGDPCVHCETPHDDVAPGPCLGKPISLTQLYADRANVRAALKLHRETSAAHERDLANQLAVLAADIAQHASGLNVDKIKLGLSVLSYRGSYTKGGEDRASVIRDAIDWLSTGKCAAWRGLDASDFGTKNYDRWSGQRSDHEWGGPAHGSICFQIGLRDRKAEMSAEQREAALYFLTNIAAYEDALQAAQVPA